MHICGHRVDRSVRLFVWLSNHWKFVRKFSISNKPKRPAPVSSHPFIHSLSFGTRDENVCGIAIDRADTKFRFKEYACDFKWALIRTIAITSIKPISKSPSAERKTPNRFCFQLNSADSIDCIYAGIHWLQWQLENESAWIFLKIDKSYLTSFRCDLHSVSRTWRRDEFTRLQHLPLYKTSVRLAHHHSFDPFRRHCSRQGAETEFLQRFGTFIILVSVSGFHSVSSIFYFFVCSWFFEFFFFFWTSNLPNVSDAAAVDISRR